MNDIAKACPLTPYTGEPKTCLNCATPLTGRATSWCTSNCMWAFYRNHRWTTARLAAIETNKAQHGVVACERCGNPAEIVTPDRIWSPEVNHKTPIMGKHGQNGCWHHVDGLEVLCHPCHVAETNRQFGRGKPETMDLFGATA